MANAKCKDVYVAHILVLGAAPGWTLQGLANFTVKGQMINISGIVGPDPTYSNELGRAALN